MVAPFHLGWFLNGTSVPAWGQEFSGAIGTQWQQAEIFVDLARALEAKHGPRFHVPDNLAAMAERGGTFYAGAEKRAA